MKNRDNFIDLMEEIDVKHLEEHINKNTDTKRKRIRSYILSAGIYAAACVAVLLLIPVIMNFTAGPTEPPVDPPGKAPMTTEPTQSDTLIDKPVDEYFADKKLYKVLDAAGVKREDVDFLQVDELQIVNGDLYYVFDGIYKNNDSVPIYTRNNPNMKYPIEYFTVTGDYIICVADEDPNKVEQDLYCYNMKTGEEILVCSDDIYHYDVYDGKVVYLTADSINNIKAVKVYTYDPETNKSTYVCDLPDTLHHICDISYNGGELAITTDARCFSSDYSILCQVTVLDMETKELRNLFATEPYIEILITDSDEGYYVACQKKVFVEGLPSYAESEYNGVWYVKTSENPVKISDDIYNELYFVNDALVGVNGDEATLIVKETDE